MIIYIYIKKKYVITVNIKGKQDSGMIFGPECCLHLRDIYMYNLICGIPPYFNSCAHLTYSLIEF